MLFSKFLSSESGAVAVDWVVLTAGLVGLGLATSMVVSGGVEDLSYDIASDLSDIRVMSGELVDLISMNFTGGDALGWIGGEVRDFGGEIGEALYIPQGRAAALTFDVPEGATEATMGLSLFGGDTLDGEDAIISVNGTPVVIATGRHGTMTIEIPRVDGTFATAEVVVEQVNLGTSPGGRYPNRGDSQAVVTIVVDDPPGELTLSVLSANSHGHNGTDEFWAIDDVDVSVQ